MKEKTKAYIISNTHWDREWYMPLEKYQVRLVKMMDRVVKIMEENPSYIFVTDGQYAVIKDYLDVKPEMSDRIKNLVKQKRLEIGPWYTQPLETLVTGEAMVKNLYYGIEESEKYGYAMKFSYMVDQFGHASQTPQILKGFGIDDALAWRGIEKDAKAVFEWEGANGDIVLMHRSVNGYGEATALPLVLDDFKEVVDGQTRGRYGLNSRIGHVKQIKDTYAVEGINAQFWLNGIDHSWAQENLYDAIDFVGEHFNEYDIKQSTLEEYAHKVRHDIQENDVKLQRYSGELMHPDEDILVCTNSTHATQKIKHYHAERILEKVAEPLHAIAYAMGMQPQDWIIEQAWKLILENHAHDSLGCCSVDEVFEHVMSRYTSSIALSEQMVDDSLAYLMSLDKEKYALYVLNTNSAGRQGAIKCSFTMAKESCYEQFDILNEVGEKTDFIIQSITTEKRIKYNAQYGHPDFLTENRYDIILQDVCLDGISLKRYTVVPHTHQDADVPDIVEVKKDDTIMENEYLKVEIDQDGCINLIDKRNNQSYNQLLQIQDSGDIGNLYMHRKPVNNVIISNYGVVANITKMVDNNLLQECKIEYILDVPSSAVANKDKRTSDTSPLSVTIVLTLLKGTPRVDIKLEIDNKSRFHQLRVLFPTGAEKSMVSLSGQPFDITPHDIGVPKGFNFARDPNCEYHPMQDFCAIGDGEKGIAIAAKGIFEYEAINDHARTLALTLMRSTAFDMDSPVDTESAYNVEKSYMFGKVEYNMSIIPFGKTFEEVYPQVLDFVNPPIVRFKRNTDESSLPFFEKPSKSTLSNMTMVDVDGQHTYITTIKRAMRHKAECIIVRLVNLSKQSQNVNVTIDKNITNGGKISLMNLNEEILEVIGQGNCASIEIGAKQVMTVCFEL